MPSETEFPFCCCCGILIRKIKFNKKRKRIWRYASIQYKREYEGTCCFIVCMDCLNNPEKINVPLVVEELKKTWDDKEDVELVKVALKKFKKGKMKKEDWRDGTIKYSLTK